jgi:hypothetical protein
MKPGVHAHPCWSTASFGDAADTSPMELSALGEHLSLCQRASGRLFALRCTAERVHDFLAARLVTTLTLLVLAIALASLML